MLKKLIKQRKMQDEQPVYYAIMEDKYEIISRGHITTDHGGRDRMLKHLCQKYMYANSTTEVVEFYKSYCLVCQKKRKHPRTTGVVVNSRGHQQVFNVCVCSSSQNLGIVDALACHETIMS